jgi:hypothetical protein
MSFKVGAIAKLKLDPLKNQPSAGESMLSSKSILQMATLDNVIDVLRKPEAKRNKNDLELVKSYFEPYEYFKNNDPDVLINCYKVMQFLELDQFEVIFDYGDKGNLFYAILQGEVGIKVPTVKERKLTEFEYIKHLYDNFTNQLFEKMDVPPKVMQKVNEYREKGDFQNEYKYVQIGCFNKIESERPKIQLQNYRNGRGLYND